MFERTKTCATQWLQAILATAVCLFMFMLFGVLWSVANVMLLVVVSVNWVGSLFPHRSEATVGKGERDDSDYTG